VLVRRRVDNHVRIVSEGPLSIGVVAQVAEYILYRRGPVAELRLELDKHVFARVDGQDASDRQFAQSLNECATQGATGSRDEYRFPAQGGVST